MNKRCWMRLSDSSSDNRKSKIGKRPRRLKWAGIVAIGVAFAMCGAVAQAGQAKVHRVGIITSGGAWYEIIDGLRVGLRKLGLEEGKQFILAIRDTKGDSGIEDAEKIE